MRFLRNTPAFLPLGLRLQGGVLGLDMGAFPWGGEAPKVRFGTKNRTLMTRMGSAALPRQTLVDASAYAENLDRHQREQAAFESGVREKAPSPVSRDLKLEALLPVIRGEKPLIVGADRFDDIHTALRIVAEFGVHMILNGGAEAYRLTEERSEREIPVLWGAMTAPHRELEATRGTTETPSLLAAAGIPFAFQTGSIQNVSGLLTQARAAFASGLPKKEALRGLTLYPAQIFGVADVLGSVETGKMADLIVLGGDPLEEASRIEMVFVGGVEVDGVR